jgi:nuclear pore complex protein Nup93
MVAFAVECQKMVADRARSLTSGPEARQKLLVLALLAGDRGAADGLLRDAPGLFATIEDFMWFRIAIIRQETDRARASATTGRTVYTLGGETSHHP